MNRHLSEQAAIFFSVMKWVFLSSVVGVIIGLIVTFFLKTVQYGEYYQNHLPFDYFYLLPFTLIFVVWFIKKFAPSATGHGTEKVIEAVHKKNGKIDIKVMPIKLIATVLTLFAGGSVGKEGPAGQIGATAASAFSDIFKFNDKDRKKIVICGISAGFASVFGTPIAGAIFGVEVLIIGAVMYDVLLPSFIAGFAAFTTARFLGIEYSYYDIHYLQNIDLNIALIVKVILAGVFFGIVSDFFVTVNNFIHELFQKIKYNIYIKAFIAGVVLVIIGVIFGKEYLGLGMDTITKALLPSAYSPENIPWYSFILKTITASLTLSGGGSGGIITPLFYVGATSGYAFGGLIDYEHIRLFAALGFISVVAGATNTPIASTIMAVELFGLDIAHYAAISAVISFLLTGHRSVFPSQILAMRKSEILKIKTGEEVEHTKIDFEDKPIKRLRALRKKIAKNKARKRNKK